MHGDCALGRRRAGNASALIGRKVFMFDKRLFSLAPGVGRLVAAKVLCQWVGLLANVVFVVTVVVMLSPALAVVESAFDPMFSMGDSGLISRLIHRFWLRRFSAGNIRRMRTGDRGLCGTAFSDDARSGLFRRGSG